MALVKSKSSKCPICTALTPTKVKEVNSGLEPILADVRETGDIPKPTDQRLDLVAHAVGISPYSLRFHLKTCLMDQEIQDQRLVELKDLTQAISTAKAEYMANPSMQNATAYTSMLNTFMSLASSIEGANDPETTVQYVTEAVIGPVTRKTLAAMVEELRTLRESLLTFVPKNQHPYLQSQVNGVVSRLSSALRETMDDGLKNLCGYYKIELEAKARKLALETQTSVRDELDGDAAVH